MKTNMLQIFFAMLFSIAMVSCNNQGARDDNNADSLEMNNNDASLFENENRDQEFMTEAAYGGLLEVELGQLAQEKAVNPRVKNFGSMMVKDHSKANDELRALAARKNMTIPTALDDDHRKTVDDMRDKTGADFDEAYMDEMVNDHQEDVDEYKTQAEKGNDSDIKAYAAKTLPVLLMHQDSAKNIRDAIKD